MKIHLIVIAALAIGCAPAFAATATVHSGAHGTIAHVRTGHAGHVDRDRGRARYHGAVRDRGPILDVLPSRMDCAWRRTHGEPLCIF